MKIYVFGNEDFESDRVALRAAKKLEGIIENIEFIKIKPNEDLPFVDESNVVIMDAVQGIKRVEVIEGDYLDKLILSPRNTAHDFDLAFQLKYLKKLGKLGAITIIGLPQEGKIDYIILQSILRKLVAQDIHGS